ncbi:MAG: AI-2E family transporter [Bacteroidetes bacterium]|nr:AI-2E family transporter [Bacteroidota bacterium]
MQEHSQQSTGYRYMVVIAALAVILFGINQAQSIVMLILLSLFFSVIAIPPVHWLEQRRVPSILAVVLVMVGMVIILLLMIVVVGTSLSAFSDALPFYQQRLHAQVLALKPWLAEKKIFVTDKVLLEYFDPGPLSGMIVAVAQRMGSLLSDAVLVLLTVMFILLEASSFPRKLRSILGDPDAEFIRFTAFAQDIKRFIVIKTIINLITGTMVTVWLTILGVDFPLLWGFMAFLLNFIPNVGSVIAAVPAVLIAFIQLGSGSAMLTAAGYFAAGTVIGNIIEPRVMGKNLGMSTLVVFLSMLFWGSLLGTMGALLCVPLTMTLMLACKTSAETEWIAVLLGRSSQTILHPPGSSRKKQKQ